MAYLYSEQKKDFNSHARVGRDKIQFLPFV